MKTILKCPFVVIKLKTGETLFAEIVSTLEYKVTVRNPFIVKTYSAGNKEAHILDRWIPFTDDEIFDIPDELCYYIGELNEQHVKFYGSYLLRLEISKLNVKGNNRIKNGEFGFSVYKDVADEIRELGEDFSIKYGISPNEHQITEDDLAEDRSLN